MYETLYRVDGTCPDCGWSGHTVDTAPILMCQHCGETKGINVPCNEDDIEVLEDVIKAD